MRALTGGLPHLRKARPMPLITICTGISSPIWRVVQPGVSLSGHEHKYDDVRCAAFGLGLGATREHTRQRSVTEEQQRPSPNAAQPSGRQFFLNQTSLLAPYRPLRVGSSLAPRLVQKSLAANAIVFMLMTTYRTNSKAKPFRYSVSGIMGMTGWSGPCENVATRRNVRRPSKAADRITS